MLFDTHFHLNDNRYTESEHKNIILDSLKNGLKGMINVSADLGESKKVVEMVLDYPEVYATVGVHPSQVDKMKEKDYKELEELLIKYPKKIVAVGECGLDFFYEQNPEKTIQIENFKKHIELAKKFLKPVIIHSRGAFKETVEIINLFPEVQFIVHCFTYGRKEMEKFIELGCYISFSGIVTFDKTGSIQEAAKYAPLDKLLCETDAPWLTPKPFRGKNNYPKYVKYVYEEIEKIRNEDIKDVVLDNVKKVFGV